MPHPLSFATHDLGLLALRFQRNHEPASFSIGLELLVSPQIAPPPQPFALADIVCDRYASGEHHSHACAAFFSTRCTAGAMDAVVEPTTSRAPWSRRSRRSSTFLARVGADGMREVRARNQRRVAASRGAAFSVLMHPCFVLFTGPSARVLPSASRSAEVGLAAAERVRVVGPAVLVDAAPLGRRPTAV